MKIALMIQCHKNPEQINLFLDTMMHPSIDFYIHVDKKSNIGEKIIKREDVRILPDSCRIDVRWADISQVDATLNLLRYVFNQGSYDFYWLCSGQDFPIKPIGEIVRWFELNTNSDFLEVLQSKNTGAPVENNFDKRNAVFFPRWMLGGDNWKRVVKRIYTELTGGYNRTYRWARRKPVNDLKFYFGSQWFCLSQRTACWILAYLDVHHEYYRFFQNCNCPDESFFHTLVMNSPYASDRKDFLHYLEWPEGKSNPKILTMSDLDSLLNSKKLMARKFDVGIDSRIIDELTRRI